VILVLSVGSFRLKRATSKPIETLVATPRIETPGPVDLSRLSALPAPVGRYLRHVGFHFCAHGERGGIREDEL
jgi:hypothetical protein